MWEDLSSCAPTDWPSPSYTGVAFPHLTVSSVSTGLGLSFNRKPGARLFTGT